MTGGANPIWSAPLSGQPCPASWETKRFDEMVNRETGPILETGKRLIIHRENVDPSWIDYNGHMNVAYYLLGFDHAVDAMFDYVGLSGAYRKANNVSSFALEYHICYLQEVGRDDPLRFEFQLLDLSDKHFHFINMMYHDGEDYLAATAEAISMHVDMGTRRGAPMAPEIQARFEAIREAHRDIPPPAQVGRRIGIRRKE